MGAKKQTIGYHYLFSVMFGICRGPIDELRMIKVGDKTAFDSHACGSSVYAIDKPDLFGGEKKEGGIQGLFRLFMGAPDQVLPGAVSAVIGSKGPYSYGTLPSVKSAVGGRMGELRGRCVLWYDGLVASMNPYLKEWKFRVRRSKKGWHNDVCWYQAKATIYMAGGSIHAMNPAHIIYQCSTDPVWGRGLDPATGIDDESFVRAANQFCEERLGLCMAWTRQDDIETFIQSVCDHAGCIVYTDKRTGRLSILAIRQDYDPAAIPLFTPETGLLEITEDDTNAGDEGFNEIIVTGHDPIKDEDIQARTHNLAARVSQEGTVSRAIAYPGAPTLALCGRLAQRDLRIPASGLRKFSVKLDRNAERITPGGVFRISSPKRGLVNVILRAGEIDDGDDNNGVIGIKAMQDVYGMPDTSFAAPVENTWSPPSTEAQPADGQMLREANYRDLYLKVGQAEANAITADDGYLTAFAGRPGLTALEYDLATRAGGEPEYTLGHVNYFTANGTLAGPLSATATSFVLNGAEDFPDDVVGDSVQIGDEVARVVAWDETTRMMTVARGAADTYPRPAASGLRVWLPDDDSGTDERIYAVGETAQAKVLTRTTEDLLPLADAPVMSVTLAGRAFRPYPPADVRVDGTSVFALAGAYPEPVLTWAGRNRLTQADKLIAFNEAGVTPEVGTTFTVRVFDTAGTLLRIAAGATSPWTYSAADQLLDGSPLTVAIEVVAVRDGVESWSPLRSTVALKAGWGYGWGTSWG